MQAKLPTHEPIGVSKYWEASAPTVPTDGTRRIVHIGLSNFHRTHQAAYFAELHDRGLAREWELLGAGVLPSDTDLISTLKRQDGTYSITVSSPRGERDVQVLRPHAHVGEYSDAPEQLITLMAAPATAIVSLTVTEGGYYLTPDRSRLDLSHPAMRKDLCDPKAFTTYVSMIVEALRRRFRAGQLPFTVMSCDNLTGNGDTCRSVICDFAAQNDPALAEWIAAKGAFPNSMVDRITPAAPPSQRRWLIEEHGLVDDVPTVAESYRRWVIEEQFVDGRPEWEQVGVEMVDDVGPYEEMKLRILNASHQAMAYVSHFLGFEYVHEAVANPNVRRFLDAFIGAESIETLAAFPQKEYRAYFDEVLSRFHNPDLGDRIDRLCWPDETMVNTFIMPVVAARAHAGKPSRAGLAILASWAEYASLTQNDDEAILRLERELQAQGGAVEEMKKWRTVMREKGVPAFISEVADADVRSVGN